MLKDHIRDYATEAFRYYAAEGKPTYEKLRQQLYTDILRREKKELSVIEGLADPTINAQINAEREVERQMPKLLDILAVEKTLDMLNIGHKYDIVKCIELVYFIEPSRAIKKGEIQERARAAGLLVCIDERTVYRYLKAARKLFAITRGLRI